MKLNGPCQQTGQIIHVDPPGEDDDPRWLALRTRNKAADGHFVYAVKTTGVYCSPSCASRQPKHENVLFFDSPDEAEAAGFLPCKRCRQRRISREAQQMEQIANACRIIERSDNPLTLAALTRMVGLSTFYFHRLFKATTGVTPKQYAHAYQHQQVRRQLMAKGSVTEAILAASYGANGRFYAQSNALLGMTPTAFRHQGQGMAIYFAVGVCSIGEILVAESERGICAILLNNCAYYRSTFVSPGLLPGKGDAVLINCLTF
ncbi:bifunctional transcriptional activator/DNA repair enzyme AdaA, partial [Brenneria salicis]